MVFDKESITGVVLAGGRARRMGGIDKGLVPLCGRTMIEHVLDHLSGQVGTVVINANRNHATYAGLLGHEGCQVVPDLDDAYAGPLAGMSAGLHASSTPWCVTVPCDSPLLGMDIVQRLYRALQARGADIAVAHDGERAHPVVTLLSADLAPSIDEFLESGERKIDRWFDLHNWVYADFSDAPGYFINVNTEEDRRIVENELCPERD
jgi:molybdopterin-guanine dinucleotide biosynthesis protein A